MKKKKSNRSSSRASKKTSSLYGFLLVAVLITIGIILVGRNITSSGMSVLGTHTLLAKGGDDSGGDSHGGADSSGSGSSGGSNTSGSSGGSGSNEGSHGSGDSGSGGSSSGGESTGGSTVSNNTKVLCTGPDGKQFETSLKDCQELNNAWHKPVNFTTLPNQTQKTTKKIENHTSFVTPKPTISHAPEAEKEDEVENETPPSATDTTTEEQENGITKVQLEEHKTRVEQIIFENGIKKKVELRNEDGQIRIRIKSEDTATGTETDQRLELNPDERIVRLKIQENGVEHEVNLKSEDDQFVLEEEGLDTDEIGTESASVTTKLPLTIDPTTNVLSVTTSFGTINIQKLPVNAVQEVLSKNTLDKVESAELEEAKKDVTNPNNQVLYKIKGTKHTKFLGLIKVDAPILTEVSAITGKQIFVNQPWYLSAFGFLFTK